jgi:hypothetical protein
MVNGECRPYLVQPRRAESMNGIYFTFFLSPLHAAKAITTTTYVYHSNQIKSNQMRSDQISWYIQYIHSHAEQEEG